MVIQACSSDLSLCLQASHVIAYLNFQAQDTNKSWAWSAASVGSSRLNSQFQVA